jgi:hypothetical protein
MEHQKLWIRLRRINLPSKHGRSGGCNREDPEPPRQPPRRPPRGELFCSPQYRAAKTALCPHWEVLSQNHPTRLHRYSPSEVEILRVSNFLTGGNQTELLRPQRIRALIRLEVKEHAVIIASMPLCDEWGLVAAPVAPEVAARGANEELTTSQRSRLVNRLLMAQEAIEEHEGPDALVHLPRWCLRPSHLASPVPQHWG